MFRMVTAVGKMNTSQPFARFAWDIYPVEREGTRALKIEMVVSLALCSQLIATTIALAFCFWALRGRCGGRCRDAALPNSTDTCSAALPNSTDTCSVALPNSTDTCRAAFICITKTGRKYHKLASSCAQHAAAYYSACAKCYPELHRRKEEQQVAVSDQVEFAASRGQSLTREM